MMTLAQAHALLPGSVLIGDPDSAAAVHFERVHSDTRSVRPGDLLVALRGERFDAHDHLAQARENGAAALLAERGIREAGLPGLQVADSYAALQTLAAAWRHRFHLPLIAVTGSNGKTTVTQMVASILREWLGVGAFATEGNYNNHIGLPLTLLRLRQDDACWHRAGVVELGMNHPGEISLLARITQPTIVLVNNAQREHQEFMASVEAVAVENGSAIEALPPSGTVVFPADDLQAGVWRAQAGSRATLTFALDVEVDIAAEIRADIAAAIAADITADLDWQSSNPAHWAMLMHTPAGEVPLRLHVAGRHNAKNALAAAACALAAGAPLAAIQRGLEAFRPVKGRSQIGSIRLHGRDVVLVDDSYNANPDSVLAAIEVLAALPAPRWLILGDMGEVGAQGPAFHAEVGARARERGIETLWCAGAASIEAARAFGPTALHFSDTVALIEALPQALPQASSQALPDVPAAAAILVKGSLFMAMGRVVRALQTQGVADAA